MSNIVELLEKLSKPKSVNMSATFSGPKNSLDKLEMYSAICIAGNINPVGLAIVMATEFGEGQYIKQLQHHLYDALGTNKTGKAMSTIVMAELCQAPLGRNVTKIKSLLKRHGPRANRSRRLIDQWKKAIKSLSRSGRHQHMIDQHEKDIASEKIALDAYAEKYAALSLNCPRCGGTGQVNSHPCKSCNGEGRYKNTVKDWRLHLQAQGVKLTHSMQLQLDEIINDLHRRKSNALNAMRARATEERIN
ncbi:TIGR02642 family protein [Vibrio mediterranei]